MTPISYVRFKTYGRKQIFKVGQRGGILHNGCSFCCVMISCCSLWIQSSRLTFYDRCWRISQGHQFKYSLRLVCLFIRDLAYQQTFLLCCHKQLLLLLDSDPRVDTLWYNMFARYEKMNLVFFFRIGRGCSQMSMFNIKVRSIIQLMRGLSACTAQRSMYINVRLL